MFDNIKNNLQSQPVGNSSARVNDLSQANNQLSGALDMFVDEEKGKANQMPPVPSVAIRSDQAALGYNSSHPTATASGSKIIVLMAIIFGVIILGLGAYFSLGLLADKGVVKIGTENEAPEKLTENILSKDAIVPDASSKNTSAGSTDDRDEDGLSDEEEIVLGTSLVDNDTDNDGLFDREEAKVYRTNPLSSDTDADGVTDGEEVRAGNNPKGTGRLYDLKGVLETPSAGLANDISQPVAPTDADGDGLTDLEESKLKTNPKMKDTDRDGLDDYKEVVVYKTNPLKKDTDGDKYSDGEEVKNGYDPLGPGKLKK